MPSSAEVAQCVREFILRQTQWLAADDLTDSDHLVERGILDSLNVIGLVDHLEEAYGIEFVPDDLFKMTTVTNVAGVVLQKLGA